MPASPLTFVGLCVLPLHICDYPGKSIHGLHSIPRHPQRFPECTIAARTSMTLLSACRVWALGAAWEPGSGPASQRPTNAALSLTDVSPDSCLQSSCCQEAIWCLDAQDTPSLGKCFLVSAPPTVGRRIANTGIFALVWSGKFPGRCFDN